MSQVATELNVQAHVLRDYQLSGWKQKTAGSWHYRDLASDPQWRNGWISFDAVTFNPHDGKIYCGLCSIDGDLLHRFDPATGEFESLDAKRWSETFDAKIHRGLLLDNSGDYFYFGTALLHDVDQQHEAPGGKLVRYNWRKDEYKVLGIAMPHLYIQSITMDEDRDIIYGFTYPAEYVFRYDITSGEFRTLAYVGNAVLFSQPHNPVVDKYGWLWGTCAETRAWDDAPGPTPIRLFKYHPDEDRFVWFDHGLSRAAGTTQLIKNLSAPNNAVRVSTETRHIKDLGVCDAMCYDGDRYIYVGTVAGVLSRIDIETGGVDEIAKAINSARFPALGFGPDGKLYGGGGLNGHTQLCRYDPHANTLETWSDLIDTNTGKRPMRIHELAVTDELLIYFGENDNSERSSYLWSATVD